MLENPRSQELVASLQELLDTSDFCGRASDVDALSLAETTNREACGLTLTADDTPWASVCSGAWIDYASGPDGIQLSL